MAGRGSRFSEQGYLDPKPLLKINNKLMIEGVIDNLKPSCKHRFIFICQEEHITKYNLDIRIASHSKKAIIIPINYITKGAASTVLLARDYIDNDSQLMIANSDQWIDFSIDYYINSFNKIGSDGMIMTMTSTEDKWSYVRFNNSGNVTEVVEKEVVSNDATVGIYNFRKGSDFCSAANDMISAEKTVNGEFYVAPVYNEMIKNSKVISTLNIGSPGQGMYGLGTPEDFQFFLKSGKEKEF